MICQAKCGMPLVPALRRQRQIGFFEFQPRMFYTAGSTQDRQSFISKTPKETKQFANQFIQQQRGAACGALDGMCV